MHAARRKTPATKKPVASTPNIEAVRLIRQWSAEPTHHDPHRTIPANDL
jgi:hypothetical protein